MIHDYWFVTRPKRKLDSIPEELAAFSSIAIGKKWSANRDNHILFEEELEQSELKREGERRDGSGSGGRTHAIMLYSLGLWFEKYDKVFLTLAGEAIMKGSSPVDVLKKQVLLFQYPSAYSEKIHLSSRFKIRPFLFLLRLLMDSNLDGYLTQEEIGSIVSIQADKETDECFSKVISSIVAFRNNPELPSDYFEKHGTSCAKQNDVANTIMNWLDYTRLVYRADGKIGILQEKKAEVAWQITNAPKFIDWPSEADVFQRKYGLDPWHVKDTRNILDTGAVSSVIINRNRILRLFFAYSSAHPVKTITNEIVEEICRKAGTEFRFTQDCLCKTYPNGAIGGYLSNYRSMAFKGRDEAIEFEIATSNLFKDIFGYKTEHLGQTGAKSAPDVLLFSDDEGYQSIIDNKAYSDYSITGDHHNRMVHNYLEGINNYSSYDCPIGFFAYISGGFTRQIDKQIKSIANESNVHGSGITVDTFISLIQKHTETPYTHKKMREIFSLDKQLTLSDL